MSQSTGVFKRHAGILLILLILLSGVSSATALSVTETPGQPPSPAVESGSPYSFSDMNETEENESLRINFNVTVYRINVHEDGNATWTLKYKKELKEGEVDDFREYISKYESDQVDPFEDMENVRVLIDEARLENVRPMSLEIKKKRVEVEESVSGNLGVASIVFNWSNYGEWKDGRLVTGDVFVNGLPIESNERLIVEFDDSLEVEKVVPQPDNNISESSVIEWRGKRLFEEGRPKVVFTNGGNEGGSSDGSGDGSGDGSSDGATDGDDTDQDSLVALLSNFGSEEVLLFLGLVSLFLVGGIIFGLRRKQAILASDSSRDTDSERRVSRDEDGGTSIKDVDGGTTTVRNDDNIDNLPASRDNSLDVIPKDTGTNPSHENQNSQTGDANEDEDQENTTDEGLLSNEDQVIKLLEENDGKMKQKQVVESTGWSKSKTSIVLSEMEEEGQVSRTKIGRQNVVTLTAESDSESSSESDSKSGSESSY